MLFVFILIQLVFYPLPLYPKIYNCLQGIDNFQLILQESDTLCFSTF
ncbi:Uncharacterised protein [Bacteroides xylanisolvens]|nr:Uncharacterised protein [Bacteroides xylanisolvens]